MELTCSSSLQFYALLLLRIQEQLAFRYHHDKHPKKKSVIIKIKKLINKAKRERAKSISWMECLDARKVKENDSESGCYNYSTKEADISYQINMNQIKELLNQAIQGQISSTY